MPKFKVTVFVFRKPGCNNPEEPTTLKALERLGFQSIEGIRMGKCFILSVNATDGTEATGIAQEASKKLLAFSVAEEYKIAEVEEVVKPVIPGG